MNKLHEEIRAAINRSNAESGSDTPDYILAEYLLGCLDSYNHAVRARDEWYSPKDKSRCPFCDDGKVIGDSAPGGIKHVCQHCSSDQTNEPSVLEPPAPEVVGELVEEVWKARAEVARLNCDLYRMWSPEAQLKVDLEESQTKVARLREESGELKTLLGMCQQYLPRRDEAPGFRGRIDKALATKEETK